MKKYIGVKLIEAEPENRGDEPGYRVKYSDNYESWSPKHQFERAYFCLADGESNVITQEDVDAFVSVKCSHKLGDQTTVTLSSTLSKFDYVTSSACVDPDNYNQELGEQYAFNKARAKVWEHLGFVLGWALKGLT